MIMMNKIRRIIGQLVNISLPELERNGQLIFKELPSDVIKNYNVRIKITEELRSRLPASFEGTELGIAVLTIGVHRKYNYSTLKPEFKIYGRTGDMRPRRFYSTASFLKSANKIFTLLAEQKIAEVVKKEAERKEAERKEAESVKKFFDSNLEFLTKELSEIVFIKLIGTTPAGESRILFDFKNNYLFIAPYFKFQNNEVTFAGGRFYFKDFKKFLKELKEKSI